MKVIHHPLIRKTKTISILTGLSGVKMVKQIGVEKGVCVEARCAETGYKWITGMAVKVFNNGRVKIATPGKSYTVSCLECRICDDVPDNLKTFFEKKRKELGLPDLSKK